MTPEEASRIARELVDRWKFGTDWKAAEESTLQAIGLQTPMGAAMLAIEVDGQLGMRVGSPAAASLRKAIARRAEGERE